MARSHDLVERVIERSHTTVAELTSQLRALSPQRTLARGYSITQLADGTALTSTANVTAGAPLTITVVDGKISATVDGG